MLWTNPGASVGAGSFTLPRTACVCFLSEFSIVSAATGAYMCTAVTPGHSAMAWSLGQWSSPRSFPEVSRES